MLSETGRPVSGAQPVDILLVEDNPTDVMMTHEAFAHHGVQNPLHVAEDGVKAMAFLKRAQCSKTRQLPGLIILDLNLPRKSGREVLEEIKTDPALMQIPVVILTTSKADEDIELCYRLHANCYIAKPVDFTRFVDIVKTINEFWFGTVILPATR